MKLIGDSIQYIEERLDEDLTVDDIARHIGISPFYYQKGFTMLCGFTVVEYIRNRRLALAGSEVLDSDRSILEIALKYGYDSPDSFSKAFARFHGSTPSSVRKSRATLKSFAPLKIKVQLEGGYLMDYRMEKKGDFTVIGNGKRFAYGGAKDVIPHFWDEHYASGKGKVVCGEFGICLDEEKGMDSFEYLIADAYRGQEVPEGVYVTVDPRVHLGDLPLQRAHAKRAPRNKRKDLHRMAAQYPGIRNRRWLLHRAVRRPEEIPVGDAGRELLLRDLDSRQEKAIREETKGLPPCQKRREIE